MFNKQDETTWTTAAISGLIFIALFALVYIWFSNPEIDANAKAYNECMSNEKMRYTAEVVAAYKGHKGNMFAHAYHKAMCEREVNK